MGKEMKAAKEIESKAKVQGKDYRRLRIISLLATICSIVAFLAVELVNSYYDISEFRPQYSLMLFGVAIFCFVSFVLCTVTAYKAKRQRHLYVVYAAVLLILSAVELVSALFVKAYSSI